MSSAQSLPSDVRAADWPALSLRPIGYLATPFRDRFGIPRQPRLAPHACGTLRLLPPCDRVEAVRGLDAFSHVWLTFVFHRTAGRWSPTVRPPRLGGNRRVGVFASRSPFRPNPLGLSLVELRALDTRDGVVLTFAGVDLLDGTPILDIKPYLPFVDREDEARTGFVAGPPVRLPVDFSARALGQLPCHAERWPDLVALLDEVLAYDPRPAYAADALRIYGFRLYDLEIQWRCTGERAIVEQILPAPAD
ncbi:MAG TPA: tRNA (N6-threonylcarbamoyladenosine(37)-N6)-methyltransferase TrmO [Accumulibacter sp.]|uniref:tRNA (N6-threonylcarbamoyladenosine(37)-N6)-methyltransferase TrmO n=1 Tax=Accumulibacter sp. TaxID=2053492 RepID=UPI0028799E92|nr:tRNA (N6-threonylcarbamoyladenosine(37)-N6)-methyltransferase TrmO [Accumulibacter sp.]MDS4054816.1 tRNA (N6-threonylcarbamoyladenosine(37)-N6)-methyltransferase TrmO [Accumulibacter sp.]HMW64057.1 tRNA (N6-threonylcarbamoyladenosine(37)-N6)-methyltransferase TrmO [Accumulibacter sp.]HMW80900.1 tRNA (N6-threonylcarbamoyladenosine(37)-N6)-methyltransferase TrmO [Accumulibacter sp.]HMX68964.1 tRNA (N6-threonylcarbamoyladenosine(37)-N6)-methyltransferase TrmO [Accumulibacter sp.]HNB67784.1 tRN